MILTLHTETVINAAHKLEGYDGACSQIHGHSWLIEVWFKGHKDWCDDVGILVDFGLVKKIHKEFDHKMINEVMDMNPTAENITKWCYDYLKVELNKLKPNNPIKLKVRVHESVVGKSAWCEGGDFE